MDNEILITIPGNPGSQGRARAAVIGGHAVIYDPKESKDYKALVRMCAADAAKQVPAIRDSGPLQGAMSLAVVAYFPIPKSWPDWQKALASKELVYHDKKPDSSNILKIVEDGLTGVIVKDDSQFASVTVVKKYSNAPRVECCIKKFGSLKRLRDIGLEWARKLKN